MKAVDLRGNVSSPSNQAIGAPTNVPPTPPANISISSGDSKVILTWTACTEKDLKGYAIYRSLTNGFIPQTIDSIAFVLKPVVTYTDSGLTNGVIYYYKIKSYDQTMFSSDTSSQVTGKPKDLTPPRAPQNLFVSDSTVSRTLTLKWNKNTEPDFLRYRVYCGTNPSPTIKIDSTIGSKEDTTKIIGGLNDGIRYHFRITAIDSLCNESIYSIEVSATPADRIAPFPKSCRSPGK